VTAAETADEQTRKEHQLLINLETQYMAENHRSHHGLQTS
jgi:hypothetical protein